MPTMTFIAGQGKVPFQPSDLLNYDSRFSYFFPELASASRTISENISKMVNSRSWR